MLSSCFCLDCIASSLWYASRGELQVWSPLLSLKLRAIALFWGWENLSCCAPRILFGFIATFYLLIASYSAPRYMSKVVTPIFIAQGTSASMRRADWGLNPQTALAWSAVLSLGTDFTHLQISASADASVWLLRLRLSRLSGRLSEKRCQHAVVPSRVEFEFYDNVHHYRYGQETPLPVSGRLVLYLIFKPWWVAAS